jgi:hypothetical protein
MRVLSMSEAALSNRVRVIERATGAYAVIKMHQVRRSVSKNQEQRMATSRVNLRLAEQFAEVLIMEGMAEVAAEAEAALQRLLELPKVRVLI